MNILDIIIAIILVFAFVRGLLNGLFSEIASLVAIMIGIFCAANYSYIIETFLNDFQFNWSNQTLKIVSFAATFLAVVLVVILIGKVLTKIADLTALGLLNKILGGIFSTLKSIVILSVIFLFFDRFNNKIPFVKQETLEESVLYQPINSFIPTVFPNILEMEIPSLDIQDKFL